mmetsp:Transcript_28834/g.83490  ORF Transcript_28834/g.83490 Transcript_28834/m.83490 type:complete len:301 (-) Transcript_28834:141-1043(-)
MPPRPRVRALAVALAGSQTERHGRGRCRWGARVVLHDEALEVFLFFDRLVGGALTYADQLGIVRELNQLDQHFAARPLLQKRESAWALLRCDLRLLRSRHSGRRQVRQGGAWRVLLALEGIDQELLDLFVKVLHLLLVLRLALVATLPCVVLLVLGIFFRRLVLVVVLLVLVLVVVACVLLALPCEDHPRVSMCKPVPLEEFVELPEVRHASPPRLLLVRLVLGRGLGEALEEVGLPARHTARPDVPERRAPRLPTAVNEQGAVAEAAAAAEGAARGAAAVSEDGRLRTAVNEGDCGGVR